MNAEALNYSFVFGDGSKMRFWRDWACWLLLVLALGCFAIGVFPQAEDWTDPVNGDQVNERRFGLAISPLFRDVKRERVARGGGFDRISEFNWFSLSALAIFTGLGCLQLLRWRWERAGVPQGKGCLQERQ